jgi:aspartate carbamoyltransferase regulatory subunit
MLERSLAASPEYLRCPNQLCISHERFDPVEHHVRVTAFFLARCFGAVCRNIISTSTPKMSCGLVLA